MFRHSQRPVSCLKIMSANDPTDRIRHLESLIQQLSDHHSQSHADCRFVPPIPEPIDANVSNLNSDQGLRIVQWQPSDQQLQPRDTGAQSWLPNARILVDRTPRAQEWSAMTKALGIDSLMEENVVASFALNLNTSQPHGPPQRRIEEPYLTGGNASLLLGAAQRYAQHTVDRNYTVENAVRLVNFQKFMLLSICAVLSEEKCPREVLIDVTRICFGGSSKKYVSRLWRSAILLNQLIDGLASRGWGNRAGELLLICGYDFAQYMCSKDLSILQGIILQASTRNWPGPLTQHLSILLPTSRLSPILLASTNDQAVILCSFHSWFTAFSRETLSMFCFITPASIKPN